MPPDQATIDARWKDDSEFCECLTWARPAQKLLTAHHPRCSKYDLESDAHETIEELLKGMDAWAADEDGIHPDAFNAYCRASVRARRKLQDWSKMAS